MHLIFRSPTLILLLFPGLAALWWHLLIGEPSRLSFLSLLPKTISRPLKSRVRELKIFGWCNFPLVSSYYLIRFNLKGNRCWWMADMVQCSSWALTCWCDLKPWGSPRNPHNCLQERWQRYSQGQMSPYGIQSPSRAGWGTRFAGEGMSQQFQLFLKLKWFCKIKGNGFLFICVYSILHK